MDVFLSTLSHVYEIHLEYVSKKLREDWLLGSSQRFDDWVLSVTNGAELDEFYHLLFCDVDIGLTGFDPSG